MMMGTNQELGRPLNKRIVLDLIRRRGPIARTDIAKAVGLSVQTVSTIVRELEDEGFLLSEREPPRGRGVPPSRLVINPEGGYAVGLYLTPLSVEAALVDLCGDVVARVRRDAEQLAPDEAFALIGSLVREIATEAAGRLLGVGMAMPGPFGVDTMSFVGSTTMAGWQGTAILDRLGEATGLAAFVETDTAAAALGEQLYGRGTALGDYYYLFFGVGLGGTMVHDGAVLRGHWGNAGEVGHMTVVPGGEPCACGNRGCLERYVSLEAFKRSGLDEAAWVDAVFPLFVQSVRTLENLFDPETIVLGGFVPDALRARVDATGDDLGSSISARRDRLLPRLMVTGDGGGEAVLRGAAALAVRGTLSPRDGQMFARAGERTHGREVTPA
jgi:predicted NBD/HSP70 family sugar kinase